MNRTNQILAIVLVLQIILAAVVFWPQTATSNAGSPLFPDLKATSVNSLTLSDGTGKHLTLTKNGESWVLPEAGDYPADSAKITPFLEKLAKIKNNRLVTETEASHTRLKVAKDNFNNLVEVNQPDGVSYKLYIGSSAGAGATHVRADDQPVVYLTNELTNFDASPQASAWLDTLYFTVPQTATQSLTLKNNNGTFEFVKEGEKWTMKGLAADETFNEANFNSLFSQATGINMTEPLGKQEEAAYGLGKPLAIVTLKTQEGGQEKTYTLQVGAKETKDNSYVFHASSSPYYVRVAEFVGQNLAEKKRTDFIQAPAMPAQEPDAIVTPAP